MQWHEPLTLALTNWYAETGGPIRVRIEAIKVQVSDLAATGTAPAGDDQCRPLIRAREPPHCNQELAELIRRNITRDALGTLL
jgi:hypothetical protein